MRFVLFLRLTKMPAAHNFYFAKTSLCFRGPASLKTQCSGQLHLNSAQFMWSEEIMFSFFLIGRVTSLFGTLLQSKARMLGHF